MKLQAPRIFSFLLALTASITFGYSATYERFGSKIDTTGFGKSVDLILRRAHKLRLESLDSALLTCDSAAAKIDILKDDRRRAIFLVTKGAILMNNGREVECLKFLKEACKIAVVQDTTRLQRVINNLFFCTYLYIGYYDVALEYGVKLLDAAIFAKDDEHIVIANFNLGLLYYKLHDSRKALKYYNTALMAMKIPTPLVYINIGLCYNQAEQYDSAFLNFEKALDIAGPNPPGSFLLNYHLGVGMALAGGKNYDSATYHHQKGMKMAAKRGDDRILADYYNALAVVLIETGQFSKALYYLHAGEKLCSANSLHSILKGIYLNFADLYSRKNDFVSASYYKEKYLQEWQLVFGEDVLNRIALIETEYAERENILKVAEGEKSMRWKNERITVRETITWLIISGAILLILVLAALISIGRIARAVNEQLESQVQLETSNVEDSLLSAIRERNTWNKSVWDLMKEIKKLVACSKGYQDVLMKTDGATGLSGTDLSGELRVLEENLKVFQKEHLF